MLQFTFLRIHFQKMFNLLLFGSNTVINKTHSIVFKVYSIFFLFVSDG